MKPYLAHLPDPHSRLKPIKTPDGKYLRELKWQRVDDWWVIKNYGRFVWNELQRSDFYEDENKTVIIVKAEKREAV